MRGAPLDREKTELQETGRVGVVGLTLAQVSSIAADLGIYGWEVEFTSEFGASLRVRKGARKKS